MIATQPNVVRHQLTVGYVPSWRLHPFCVPTQQPGIIVFPATKRARPLALSRGMAETAVIRKNLPDFHASQRTARPAQQFGCRYQPINTWFK